MTRGMLFYPATLGILADAGVPFMVGGGHALTHHTGIDRGTKDLDVFVRPTDAERALETLARAGFRTEMTFPHWLGKAFDGGSLFIDVIFSSGNGTAVVDDEWFQHAQDGETFGLPMRICPAEEMIWSKAFIMERERFDGADVAHLLRETAGRLDWARLVRRFGKDWRVLLSHLTLFGFIYPAEREKIPAPVMADLCQRLADELCKNEGGQVCQGTLLSREQYLVDLEEWGYEDGRLRPDVRMTPEDIALWTNAIPARSAQHAQRKRDPRRRR